MKTRMFFIILMATGIPASAWAWGNPKSESHKDIDRLTRELNEVSRQRTRSMSPRKPSRKEKELRKEILKKRIWDSTYGSSAVPWFARETNPQLKRSRSMSDQDLSSLIGLGEDGTVSNEMELAWEFEFDSFVAWQEHTGDIKLGISGLLWRFGSAPRLSLNLDASDNYVGLSTNVVLVPVIRLEGGIGYGHLFDRHEQTWILRGSIRLW